MDQQRNSATTQASCEATCCADKTCLVWQWCAAPSCGGANGGCWLGSNVSACDKPGPGWVSFARPQPSPAPPPPPPPCIDPADPCSIAFVDGSWRTVNTPHDFVVEGSPDPTADRGHGYLPFNVSWYRKHFTVDPSLQGAAMWLEFDGVYRNSDIWLNGVHVYHQNSGYVSFQFYIHNVTGTDGKSPALLYGADNVLVVRADALTAQEGWFYEGGGITRHVWINAADPLFLVPWSPFFPSAITGAITSGPLGNMGPQTAASAVVLGQADVYNSRPGPQVFELKFSVFDASGAPVASSTVHANLTQGGWGRYYAQIALPGPVMLWNTEATYLYTVTTTISVGGSTVDAVGVSIGVRDAFWSPNTGFTLNGMKLSAQGFSNHQDFGGCGTAVPDRINEFRVTSLRAIGSNFWRTAHNPVNPELLDYCDAHGMLVWLENRFINPGVQPISGPQDPPLPPTVAVADPGLLKDAQDMVIRGRNHPSVVIYSLCNEGGCEIGRTFGGVIGAQFKDVISQADTSRPLTANSEWGVGSADTLTNIVDVMTCSYSYSTYTNYHLTHPWKPIMGGESASCTSDRGFYGPSNKTEGVVNANDFGCVANSVASYAVNAWDSGNFGWTGHDYKGEPTPDNWPCVNSHFGVLDMAGFEKDSAGYYRAWWRADGAASVFASPRDWTSPVLVGTRIPLFAFTAAPFAEAIVNGVSQGRVNVSAYGYAAWPPVPFAPGSFVVRAFDASGNAVAEETIATVGKPAALRLQVETIGARPLAADGADVALVSASVVDASGAVVPGAAHEITWAVSGEGHLYGLANGKSNDLKPDKVGHPDLPYGGVWRRGAYMGRARAIVMTTTTAGAIHLSASAPGLSNASVTFSSQ